MRKRYIASAVAILLVIAIIAAAIYYIPKSVKLTVSGIQYRLGEENKQIVEPIEVNIDGRIGRLWNGDRFFEGDISLPQLQLPIPDSAKLMRISLGEDHSGTMTYHYVEDGSPSLFSLGTVFFSKDFEALTILLLDRDESGGGSWNAQNGAMLSAPAANREQALILSNQLMKQFLQGAEELK